MSSSGIKSSSSIIERSFEISVRRSSPNFSLTSSNSSIILLMIFCLSDNKTLYSSIKLFNLAISAKILSFSKPVNFDNLISRISLA